MLRVAYEEKMEGISATGFFALSSGNIAFLIKKYEIAVNLLTY